ncbi:MAG: YdcF family protein [Prevotellaceae bacterium]|jgi:uncharacterized SAM-binding protein YcdF (DUF218 family)|nr:YdcF family protein [Prevotellaceae bacterium]
MKQNPDATIIVSGGQRIDETISETLAMERYLIANGIDKAKIYREEASTDTYENFEFSKRIIDSLPKGFTRQPAVVYITNDFHSYRAGKIAKRQDIEASSYSSSFPYYMHPPTYLREVLAIFKFWISR